MVRYTVDEEHRPYLTPEQAVEIVREHGIMLEAARGPAPSFASVAAGETVPGNWWGHPRRYHIFNAIDAVRRSELGHGASCATPGAPILESKRPGAVR